MEIRQPDSVKAPASESEIQRWYREIKALSHISAAPRGETLNKGIEFAGRMIATLKKGSICDGVHIVAIGREEIVPDILAAAGLSA